MSLFVLTFGQLGTVVQRVLSTSILLSVSTRLLSRQRGMDTLKGDQLCLKFQTFNAGDVFSCVKYVLLLALWSTVCFGICFHPKHLTSGDKIRNL